MKNELNHYHRVQTEDGTVTLHSHVFDESCHSLSGAWEETLTHYFRGCEIETKILENKEISILEIGFGTGLGFILTYSYLKKYLDQNYSLHFTSVEIDPDLILWIKDNARTFHQHADISPEAFDILSSLEITKNCALAVGKNVTLTIILGNATETLTHVDKKFDAIYQDAFSPKKNPQLWSVQWFCLLKKLSHPKTNLSTYSSSVGIRKAMLEAGWSLFSGEKFGKKRTSTRANFSGPSSPEILKQLERSPIKPFSQENN